MEYCRTDLWDSGLTWFTDSPQLTECFQDTVLVYIPVLVLLLTLPLDVYNCLTSKAREIPWSARIVLRLSLTITISVLAVLELIFSDFSSSPVYTEDIVGPVLKFLSGLVLVLMTAASKHCGQVYSPAQFVFWSSAAICQSLSVINLVLSGYTTNNRADSIMTTERSDRETVRGTVTSPHYLLYLGPAWPINSED